MRRERGRERGGGEMGWFEGKGRGREGNRGMGADRVYMVSSCASSRLVRGEKTFLGMRWR